MSDLVDKIREALLSTPEEAKAEAERLKAENDSLKEIVLGLRHKLKVLAFELQARSAAAEVLGEMLEEMQRELDGRREPAPVKDRLGEDGEPDFAPNFPSDVD